MMKGGGGSKRRFLKAFLSACRKLSAGPTAGEWAHLGGFGDKAIPRDVPKGHTVVYVGEELRRYVVRVSSLDHPLFRELLDRAREEYEFAAADSRLCIPCDEDIFLGVSSAMWTPGKSGGCRCAADHGIISARATLVILVGAFLSRSWSYVNLQMYRV